MEGQKQTRSMSITKLFTFHSTVRDILLHWNSIRTQRYTWLRIWYVWLMSLSIQLQSIKNPSKMWLTTRTSLPTNPTPKSALWFIQFSAPPPNILYMERDLGFFKYKEQKSCSVAWCLSMGGIALPLLTSGKPSPLLYLVRLWPERKSTPCHGVAR